MKDRFLKTLQTAEMLDHLPYDFPLLMSAPMVLGLLREVRQEPGGKRETRRFETPILRAAERAQAEGRALSAWVREGWQAWKDFDDKPPRDIPQDADVLYMADRPRSLWDSCRRAPFHMPRWASRITLLDVTIRRERLGDISEESALAEGVCWSDRWHGFVVPGVEHTNKDFPVLSRPTAREMYAALWDTLHGSGHWWLNFDREIMVLTFRPMLVNIDGIGAEHGR
jgi:hypothetical protein